MVKRVRLAIGLWCGAIILALKGCETIRRPCSSVREACLTGLSGCVPRTISSRKAAKSAKEMLNAALGIIRASLLFSLRDGSS